MCGRLASMEEFHDLWGVLIAYGVAQPLRRPIDNHVPAPVPATTNVTRDVRGEVTT